MYIIDTVGAFEKKLAEESLPILAVFVSSVSPESLKLFRIMDECGFEEKYAGRVIFVAFACNDHFNGTSRSFCEKMGINSCPSLLMFFNNIRINSYQGGNLKKKLVAVKKHGSKALLEVEIFIEESLLSTRGYGCSKD